MKLLEQSLQSPPTRYDAHAMRIMSGNPGVQGDEARVEAPCLFASPVKAWRLRHAMDHGPMDPRRRGKSGAMNRTYRFALWR